MKNVLLSLPKSQYQYEVKIGSGILKEALAEQLAHYSEDEIYIVTNDTIHDFYPDFIPKYIPENLKAHLLILPDGEEFKNMDCLDRIYDFLAEHKTNRKSLVLAFGGGVIGDMTGFAAATYMRGINYIQVPTTLLSQVDSSIGGKTGVNHPAGKNFIGAFKQPLQTIIDISFLRTLPHREFVAGYAELIKHGMIQDAYLFEILKRNGVEKLKSKEDLLIDAVFRSCEVKARVVQSDETESNQRAILNFGHTLGHFLETYTDYKKFLHGEAVLVGMDFAGYWSVKNNLLHKSEYELIREHLHSLKVCLEIPNVDKGRFIEIIEHDKKNTSAGTRFIALTSIGKAGIIEGVSSENLWSTFQEMIIMEGSMLKMT